jgi:tetratricopeptide (TPR) repeat protein
MSAVTPCPDADTWQQMVQGHFDDNQCQTLEEHLEQCPACLTLVQQLAQSDPLAQALRQPPRRTEPSLLQDMDVAGLLQRCKALRTPADLSQSNSMQNGSASGTPAPAPAEGPDCPLPTVAGYEVLGVLGRGGMGVVYQARHLALGRVVALKMVLAGAHADAEELRRFRREAEAVARLQHPGIVQVFEVGQHEGVPFLALEYCAGGSLHRKLAGTPLPPGEATRLAEALARALAAAHHKQIIHRDLKPHNVLLTESGVPKITDFGLAKKLDGVSAGTQTGAVVGTPSYMPPEQARGQPAGPTADVYALGAVLYEMLTGRPPFLGPDTYAVLASVLQEEAVAVRRLQPAVPRDLETICLKCLRKEPGTRYAGALELAEDLRRFQQGEPIRARPVGRTERLAKWARRRPAVAALSGALLAATLLLIVGLITGIVVTTNALGEARRAGQAEAMQRQDAEKARDDAERRLNQTRKAKEILVSIFRDLNPRLEEKGGPPLRAQLGERLDKAVEVLEGEAVSDSLEVAQLQQTLGLAQLHLGYRDRAITLFTRARQTLNAELGPDHPDTLTSISNLARAYQDTGQWAKALPLHEQTLAKRSATLGPDHPDTLVSMNNLALAYQATGQRTKALPLLEQTLEKRKEILGPDHLNTLVSMNNLGLAYRDDGQWDKAVPLLEQTLEKRKATLGPDHPDTLSSMNNLALAYQAAGQLAKALPLFEQTLEKRKAKQGPDHPDTLNSMHNLANAYQVDGQWAKALPLLEQSLEKRKAKQGSDHPDTLTTMNSLAMAYRGDSQLDKALPLFEQTLAKRSATLGPDHPSTLVSMNNLADAYRVTGKLAKALSLFEETLEKRQAKLRPNHPDTLNSMNNLARAYQDAGQLAKALPLLEQTLEKKSVALGPDHPDTLTTMNSLGLAYRDDGQWDKAVPLLEQTLEKMKAKLSPDHPNTLTCMDNLAGAYELAQTFTKAELLRRDLLTANRKRWGPDHANTASALVGLGAVLVHQKKYTDAEAPLRECIDLRVKLEPKSWLTFNSKMWLGAALLGQQKYAEAEPLLVQGYEGMKQREAKIPAQAKVRLTEALERLVQLYDATGQKDKADEWRKQLEQTKAAAKPPAPP